MSADLKRLLSLSQDKLALYALGLAKKLQKLEAQKPESLSRSPIAVVGAACRFPGGVSSLEAFEELLFSGRDPLGPVPEDRWDSARYYRPGSAQPGKILVNEGGFLDDIDRFDAGFFGISPREAASMDPQQRVTLEVAWQALESAGIAPDSLNESASGVYMGVAAQDYSRLVNDPSEMDKHFGSGNGNSVISGRLSYQLGLRGPAVSIDTACSSSLVAVHLAMLSLRAEETDLALAGGVNAILSPDGHIALSQTGMLAPDGRCKAFDSRADGFVRSEGCGIVVLKRLADAQRDGDPILGVLRGSAINQDGRSSSLTAPNGPSQEAVIEAALKNADLPPQAISVLETHGTGTELGDPIEANAAARIYGRGRAVDCPLVLGALKSQVGHMETAAGVGGLIKLLIQLKREEIPGLLQLEHPSPHIAWQNLPLHLPRGKEAWRSDGEDPRRAGLSSFGYSGTNAHLIVEEAPKTAALTDAGQQAGDWDLLLLSARSKSALTALASAYHDALSDLEQATGSQSWRDLCHSSRQGRAALSYRLAILARSPAEARQKLQAVKDGQDEPRLLANLDGGEVAFVFTGQGSQSPGMAAWFLETWPLFRDTVATCDALVAGRDGWTFAEQPLLALLSTDTPPAEWPDCRQTAYAQPLLFAFEVALGRLWLSFGLTPMALLGHSLGEIAAATLSGVFTMEEGFLLALERGRLMQAQPTGAMVSLACGEGQAQELLAASPGKDAGLAALNGPARTVVSGPAEDMARLQEAAQKAGIKAQSLEVSHAFHSTMMTAARAPLEKTVAGMNPGKASLPLLSNLSGDWVDEGRLSQPAYWGEHLMSPVRFQAAAHKLLAENPAAIVEVGPRPQLLSLLSEIAAEQGKPAPTSVVSQRAEQDPEKTFLDALAQLFLAGVKLDWSPLKARKGAGFAPLPFTPFERRRHWLDLAGQGAVASDSHPLLGREISTPLAARLFENQLTGGRPDWLQDHRVEGQALFPATGYVELALAAAQAIWGDGPVQLDELLLTRGLEFGQLEDGEGATKITLQTLALPEGDSYRLQFFSRQGENYLEHASVRLSKGSDGHRNLTAPEVSKASGKLDLAALRAAQARHGLSLTGAFAGLEWVARQDSQLIGQVRLPETVSPDGYLCHPALLDAALQVLGAACLESETQEVFVPAVIGRIRVIRPLTGSLQVLANWSQEDSSEARAALQLFDEEGSLLAEITDLRLRPLQSGSTPGGLQAGLESAGPADWLHHLVWRDGGSWDRSADLPDWQATVAATQELGQDLTRDESLTAYGSFLSALEDLAPDLIVAAFLEAGLSWKEGDGLAEDDLRHLAGVADTRRDLFHRLLQILKEAGWLEAGEGDGLTALKDLRPLQADGLEKLKAAYPDQANELAMIGRCAAGLAQVVKGGDPLAYLFPEGQLDAAEDLYALSPLGKALGQLAARALERLLQARPGRRALRIFEIGAGTGSMTSALLSVAPEDSVEYWVSDISPRFLEHLQEKWADRKGLVFKPYNAELSPKAQDLPEGRFDLVVASNVLHATQDLAESLTLARRLLLPQGQLMLLEATQAKRGADLTFGLTDGWWRFTDRDLRPDHPLLSRQGWRDLLPRCGFAETAILPQENDSLLDGHALILAQASQVPESRHVLLVGGGSAQAPLTTALQALGAQVSCLAAGEDLTAREGDLLVDLRPLEGQEDPARAALTSCAETADLLRSVAGWTRAPSLRLVTRNVREGDDQAGLAGAALSGLVRVLRREQPELTARLIDVRLDDPLVWQALAHELLAEAAEGEVALRGPRRVIPQVAEDAAASCLAAPYRIAIEERGSLDGLVFQPQERKAPGAGEVEIRVAAVGLNFRDLLNVMGLYPGELGDPGEEISGEIVALGEGVTGLEVGQKVLAPVQGSMACYTLAAADSLRPVPAGLDLLAASAQPIAYLTAVVALSHLGKMKKGERVLIHAAAGGVGLAAVHLAQRAGLEVFATAHPDKWPLLQSLGITGLASSRVSGLVPAVQDWSRGQGVDLVLNCLQEPFISESFEVLKEGGRFLEIGRRGIRSRQQVAEQRPDVSYHPIVVAEEIAKTPDAIQALYDEALTALGDGSLPALPVTTFPASRVKDALQLLQRGGHQGRLVLDFHQSQGLEPRADGSYLITGGRRGLGPLVARWLAEQGAGRLVLLGRREADEAGQDLIAAARAAGADVLEVSLDVSDKAALAQLIADQDDPARPWRGFVHCAGVLDDGPLVALDEARFQTVFAPKVDAAWQLHELSKDLPLDFFLLFSAGAALFGSPGQANHAAANAFLDTLASHRHSLGLPALSINWGPWAELGAVADDSLRQRMAQQGMGEIAPDLGLASLDLAVRDGAAQLAVLPFDWPTFLSKFGSGSTPDLIASLAEAKRQNSGAANLALQLDKGSQAAAPADTQDRGTGPDLPASPEALAQAIRRLAGQVLGLDEAIDDKRPLSDLGLDSLMSVELRNRLAQRLGLTLPATLLFDHPTVAALTEDLGQRLWGNSTPPAEATEVATPVLADSSGGEGKSRDVAIIGLGCRLPGGAVDRETFWALLAEGRDAVTQVPADRWDIDAYYDPDPDKPGKTYARHGGFLDQVDRFDAAFFNISPREANSLDPQQRLVLECAWEALEDAGQPADKLDGEDVGVFLGICGSDYLQLQMASGGALGSDPYLATGNASSVAAGRVAYALGFQGPAVAVDTACSSSLVAVHLARRSLLDDECRVALVGGVNVMLEPGVAVNFAKSRMLAADGHCKSFDASADGFVRGEGCVMLAMKRLDEAERDGDPILAVLAGSAMNQDGRSAGLTAPNGPSQERVIRRALKDARLSPAVVDYVEAHGSGTSLGDPIEAQALGAVMGEGRTAGQPLKIGSVKTNLGHLEGAAGVAGLAKTVLALGQKKLPASLHFDTPSPHIDWQNLPIEVVSELEDWPAEKGQRVAGVSSFGFSGTNVHLLLRDADQAGSDPADPSDAAAPQALDCQLLVISAHDPQALRALAERYLQHCQTLSGQTDADSAFRRLVAASQHRRAHLPCRLALAVADAPAAVEALTVWLAEQDHPAVAEGRVPEGASPKLAFVYPGQGGQWLGMGRQLFEQSAAFRDAFRTASTACESQGTAELEALLLTGEEADLAPIDRIQPLLFCLQIAVTRTWQALGLCPAVVVGHSMGETAAAVISGALDLDSAARVICLRSRLMKKLSGQGAMLVTALSFEEAQALVAGGDGSVAVAVSNSRRSTVLSGAADSIDRIAKDLEAKQIFNRLVKVDVASHGPQVDSLKDELIESLSGLASQEATLLMDSTVVSRPVAEGELTEAEYWWSNLRQPVRFAQAQARLLEQGVTQVVEVGPHPVLTAAVEEESLALGQPVSALGSLERDGDDARALLTTLGRLYVEGVMPDWSALTSPPQGAVSLPLYPWQRQRHWFAAAAPALRPGLVETTAPWADKVYEVVWRALPLPGATEAADARWLILDLSETGQGEQLAAKLADAGQTAEHLLLGRPDLTADLPDVSGRSVVVLGAATAADRPQITAVLDLLRRLYLSQADTIWTVTQGAQQVSSGDRDLDPQAAALWGFVRVSMLEKSNINGGLIDVSNVEREIDGSLIPCLLAGQNEDQLALRDGRLYGARLTTTTALLPAKPNFDPQAVYLLTGGFGGIGVQLAEWLADQGVRHLRLVSRRGRAEGELAERLRQLEGRGVEIEALAVDLANAADLTAVLRSDEARPLKGIFHLAGITEPCKLEELDQASLARVWAPKLTAAHNLMAGAEGLPLEHFVAFSTGAAIWGSEGQAAYGAASAALDCLMAQGRAKGLPCLSLNWGWWQDSGMVSAEAADYFSQMGFHPVPGEEALGAMAAVMAQPPGFGSRAVANFDWSLFKAVQEAKRPRPLLEEMGSGMPAVASGQEGGRLLALLTPLSEAERESTLLQELRTTLAEVLGFDNPELLEDETGFFQLGMDSIMAVKLRGLLERDMKEAFPPSLAFEYPNLLALRDHLLSLLPSAGTQADEAVAETSGEDSASDTSANDTSLTGSAADGAAAADPLDDLLSQIGDLEEDEIDRLLADGPAQE
ncbi:SDR family NAD(P)-dependent oxidoreductase [Rhodovibrionaceae bacterium A322]